jgi:hypothetical protein
MLDYRHESLEVWPKDVVCTAPGDRRHSPFRSTWSASLKVLERELLHLEAHPDRTRFKTFHRPSVVRRDGQLRSDAPMPDNPGVILTFEVFQENGTFNDRGQRLGRYVPVQFECDTFTHWKDNARAIALALEALRKVERYGVARARAVEVGRKQLPAHVGQGLTIDDALAVLSKFSGRTVAELRNSPGLIKAAHRKASIEAHPDRGGNHEDAVKINVAYETLKAALELT